MNITSKKLFKQLRYLLEGLIAYILYLFFKLLPIDLASYIAGKIAMIIGPRLKISNVARSNLKLCFPNFSDDDINQKIILMWDNLGRIIGEFPHWATLSDKEFSRRIKINSPTFEKKSLLLSGHLGNFDLIRICGVLNPNIKLIYRPANNPYLEKIIKNVRDKNNLDLLSKTKAGVRDILNALQNNHGIGMLIDQRLNSGVEIPFFNIPAKTTSLPAQLAIKYNIPIYMTRIRRLKGAYYEVNSFKLEGYENKNVLELTKIINEVIEKWIIEIPEQWYWIHKRWKI